MSFSDIPKSQVREFVKARFPYSTVQPFLEGLVKYGEYVPVQSPMTPPQFEGLVYFNVDKFWNDLTDRLCD